MLWDCSCHGYTDCFDQTSFRLFVYISLKWVNLKFLAILGVRESKRETSRGEKQHLGDKCVRSCSHDNRSWASGAAIWRLFLGCNKVNHIVSFFSWFKEVTWFLRRDEKHCCFQLPPAPSPCHPSLVFKERERGEIKDFHPSFSFPSSHPSYHFYASYREADWKHSLAFQTMKKGDPQSFIRYEDLQ